MRIGGKDYYAAATSSPRTPTTVASATAGAGASRHKPRAPGPRRGRPRPPIIHSAARRRKPWEGGCEPAAADPVVKIIMHDGPTLICVSIVWIQSLGTDCERAAAFEPSFFKSRMDPPKVLRGPYLGIYNIQCHEAKTYQISNGHCEGPIDFFDQPFYT